MSKTIKEWAELCADDTIRQQWIKYIEEECSWSDEFEEDMYRALSASFTWHETYEGYEYWGKICDDMRDNPEKYLKKRKAMFIYE